MTSRRRPTLTVLIRPALINVHILVLPIFVSLHAVFTETASGFIAVRASSEVTLMLIAAQVPALSRVRAQDDCYSRSETNKMNLVGNCFREFQRVSASSRLRVLFFKKTQQTLCSTFG